MPGTTRTRARALSALAVAAAMLLGACGGDDDDAATDDAATDTTGDDAATDTTGASDDELVDPPAGGATAGEPVDVCSFISATDVSEATGTEFAEGEAQTPNGALLGQCDFTAVDITNAETQFVNVSARPAAEYDATVEVSGNPTPVEGFSVDANQTDAGLMLRYEDFMIVIFAVGSEGFDHEAEVAVGRVIDENIG